MRQLLLLCALLCFALAPAPSAQAMDLNDLKCHELLALSEDDIGIYIVWIDGYFSGKTGSTDFDPDSWEGLGELIGTMCGSNPDRLVLSGLKDVMDAIKGK